MSLINKMLRDLDARHAPAGTSPLPNQVRSLPDSGARTRAKPVLWIMLSLAAGVAAIVQFAGDGPLQLHTPAKTAVTPPPIAANVPAPAPAPAATQAQAGLADDVVPLPRLPDALLIEAAASTPAASTRSELKLDTALARDPKPLAAKSATAASTRPSQDNVAVRIDSDALAGDRTEAEYRKGVAAFRQGRVSDATAQFKSVLKEDPRHLGARQALLGMLAENKQWDEAQALLKDALAIMPTHYLWAMALARIQVERGNSAGAWETLQAHIAYAENKADYQGFAGVLLQRLQRPREAALRFQAAVQLQPGEGRWWLGLGLALEADGRAAEARDAFMRAQRAGELSPETQAFLEKKLR